MNNYLTAKKEANIYEHRAVALQELIQVEVESRDALKKTLDKERKEVEHLKELKTRMNKGKKKCRLVIV